MGRGTKDIPLHRLDDHTDLGFQVERVNLHNKAAKNAILLDAHRDDHFIFMIQLGGRSKCMVDFSLYSLSKNTVFFILPGQVHQYMDADDSTEGWFVAIDPGRVTGLVRSVLEDPFLAKATLRATQEELEPLLQCLELLLVSCQAQPGSAYSKQASYGLLHTFCNMVAGLYAPRVSDPGREMLRPRLITQEFRKLLSERYKTCKSPAEYAAALNISHSYLNEVVKATTGFAVSYWIQQEVLLEARRLLYHSDCSVKEIAYAVGYEDHAYFSRLFSKTMGYTPGAFRKRYRE